jgi:tRNA A37 threonylcarbamoyladenosine modification protein TsaB
MTLFIDATEIPEVALSLETGNKKFSHKFICERNLSEKLLPEIQKFLKKNKIPLSQISKIETSSGAGHFSRIRTAVATANALAFGLNLKQQSIKPVYDKPANITMSKKNL